MPKAEAAETSNIPEAAVEEARTEEVSKFLKSKRFSHILSAEGVVLATGNGAATLKWGRTGRAQI